jgi:transposase
VAHSDETGIKIGGVNNWLHVLCTPKTTYFFPHEKRGREAIDAMGLLENFDGILCHDHWKPYFGYGGDFNVTAKWFERSFLLFDLGR